MHLTIRNATFEDLPQVARLQSQYHVQTILEADKADGFVTTLFTEDQFKAIIQDEGGLAIALDGETVIGYAMAASWHYWQAWPLFQHMIQDLPSTTFMGDQLNMDNSYQYGPICVDKAYRGTQVFPKLFDFSRAQMAPRYRHLITFINHINPRSYAAHVTKLGLTVIKDFSFNQNQYYMLGYDTQKPIKG